MARWDDDASYLVPGVALRHVVEALEDLSSPLVERRSIYAALLKDQARRQERWTARECANMAAELLRRADHLAGGGTDKRQLEPLWEQVRHWLAVGSRFLSLDHLERSVPQGEGDPR